MRLEGFGPILKDLAPPSLDRRGCGPDAVRLGALRVFGMRLGARGGVWGVKARISARNVA